MHSKAVYILAIFLSLLEVPGYAEEQRRVVFFDVEVEPRLENLASSRSFLSQTLGNGLASVEGFQVIDKGTRDSLFLQRKLSLEDCSKPECRFSMIRSLPSIDVFVESEIKATESTCYLMVQAKSAKTGTILNSIEERTDCSVDDAIRAIKLAGANVLASDHSTGLPSGKPTVTTITPPRYRFDYVPIRFRVVVPGETYQVSALAQGTLYKCEVSYSSPCEFDVAEGYLQFKATGFGDFAGSADIKRPTTVALDYRTFWGRFLPIFGLCTGSGLLVGGLAAAVSTANEGRDKEEWFACFSITGAISGIVTAAFQDKPKHYTVKDTAQDVFDQ